MTSKLPKPYFEKPIKDTLKKKTDDKEIKRMISELVELSKENLKVEEEIEDDCLDLR